MKPKHIKSAVLNLALATGLVLVPSASVYAANHKPYFKVFGADAYAGGWFNNLAQACSNSSGSNYQAPLYSSATGKYDPATVNNGGIFGFARVGGNRTGASSELGAFGLGLIQGQASSDYGFYSGTGATNGLSFSNTNDVNDQASTYWGGFLEGTVRQSHCLPDYFETKQISPAALGGKTAGQLSSGQYIDSSALVTLVNKNSGETIAAGTKLTIFVAGDVFIGNNITYAGGYNETNVPKFALVVKGNIYVGPNASRLDGFYIAQPDTTDAQSTVNTGFIWTCHDSNTNLPDGAWLKQNCSQKLTVNGSLMAKQVNLTRTPGDVANASNGEGSGSGNIAEVVNYTPEMVVGGPFFNPPASNTATYKVQSLISLPPVF